MATPWRMTIVPRTVPMSLATVATPFFRPTSSVIPVSTCVVVATATPSYPRQWCVVPLRAPVINRKIVRARVPTVPRTPSSSPPSYVAAHWECAMLPRPALVTTHCVPRGTPTTRRGMCVIGARASVTWNYCAAGFHPVVPRPPTPPPSVVLNTDNVIYRSTAQIRALIVPRICTPTPQLVVVSMAPPANATTVRGRQMFVL